MPKPEDAARREMREFLAMLRDGLSQPPLSAKLRLCI
jgi:hypothetical protein